MPWEEIQISQQQCFIFRHLYIGEIPTYAVGPAPDTGYYYWPCTPEGYLLPGQDDKVGTAKTLQLAQGQARIQIREAITELIRRAVTIRLELNQLCKCNIGDEVAWTTYRGKQSFPKQGTVVNIVPANARVWNSVPSLDLYSRFVFDQYAYNRSHESYLVEVPVPNRKPKLYWPPVGKLVKLT